MLILLTMAAAYWFALHVRDIWQNGAFTDFEAMVRGAQAAANRQSPYDLEGLRDMPFGAFYKYPPLFATLLAPLARMDYRQLVHLWLADCLVLYVLAFLLLVRTEALSPRGVPFYLLAIAFLLFQPSLDTLFGGQLEFLLLFLFTIAYWAARQAPERSAVLGASIAFATLLKLYPIVLLIYPLVKRSRAVIWFLVSIGLLSLYSILIAGWQPQQQFYLQVLPTQPGGTAWLENQSFFGFFSRLWVNGATVDGYHATQLPVASLLSSVASLLALVLSVVTILAAPHPMYAFVILVPLGLLVPPAAWIHYETVLLLPLGILLTRASQGWTPIVWIPLFLAFPLLAFGNEDAVKSASSGLIQSFKFYGVFLVWLTGVVWAWHDRLSGQLARPPAPTDLGQNVR
jgi:Glycosyltransferase family 87